MPAPQPATRRQHLSVSLLKKHKPETQDSTKRTCSEEHWRRDTFRFFFYIYIHINALQMCTCSPFMNSHFFFCHKNAIIDNWYEYEIYCRILPLFLTAPAPLYLHFGFYTFPVKSTGFRISLLSAWASDGHLDSPRCLQPVITRQKKRTRAVDAPKVKTTTSAVPLDPACRQP